ncbi:lactate utilization protein [Clostridium sp.]|uniref:lactate utilization protein n=1 Tax=Clostridium sp. TaxID=1506 RepID=UPI00261C93BA|nr:lactate utilization protein [Clostridium sp.]
MDKNVLWLREKRINKTIEALKANNMNGYLVNSREELIEKIKELTKEGDVVATGGSMSLFETGVIEHLRCGRYEFLDRYKEGLTADEIKNIYRGAFSSDVYFTSVNAITEEGEIYNVDGNGNRVAAMLYGPDKVIIVVGFNKIVSDLEEAIERNRKIAAPTNAKRLNRKTPCSVTGTCMDCKSPEKICREYTLIRSQGNPDRIHIIFLNEDLGY